MNSKTISLYLLLALSPACAGSDPEPPAATQDELTREELDDELESIAEGARKRGAVTHDDIARGLALIEDQVGRLGPDVIRLERQAFLSRMTRLSWSRE